MKPGDDALRAALGSTRSASPGPRLDASTFVGLREIVERACGIELEATSRFLVERRLRARIRALHLDDFESYYRYLLYGPERSEEIAQMLEAVTVRETYFFREWRQLACFRDAMLPALAEENARTRTLRIWSAGCATGEEPLSIAILVRESGRFDDWNVRVVGTDLVEAALKAARRGSFRESSLRATPDDLRERYFRREGERAWRVDDDVLRMVELERANLVDEADGAPAGSFDVIFCRNVLMYLGERARLRAAARLYERLRSGGRLLLGHAESLLGLDTPFRLEHAGRDIVYVK